jgi:hypothetical protein
MNDELKMLVVAREHANLDSLPLRFGIHFSVDTDVLIYNYIDLGVDDRYRDRHHYEGYIRNPSDPEQQGLFGHFVIAYRQHGNYWALVTAWRNSNKDAEYFLSNTLRNLREDGILNPSMLQRMHPHYINGEINTSASLISYLSKTLAQDEITRAKASEDRARIDTEQALKDMKFAREEAEAARREADRARSVAMEAIEVVETLSVRVTNAEQAEQEARALLADAMAVIRQNDAHQAGSDKQEQAAEGVPAHAVTAVWQSKTGSGYRNVGLEATVVDVAELGGKIKLTYIGKDGLEKSVQDFGYQGLVEPVFAYLTSRKGKRAVFLVTQKPGKDVKLASDTMMLPTYQGLWA